MLMKLDLRGRGSARRQKITERSPHGGTIKPKP
jgi:hypothetical protein